MMFSLSTKKMKKIVDNVFFETYNVLNEHERRQEMTETIENKKNDAKELIEIISKVPPEKKGEVLGIVKGFALGLEASYTKPNRGNSV